MKRIDQWKKKRFALRAQLPHLKRQANAAARAYARAVKELNTIEERINDLLAQSK